MKKTPGASETFPRWLVLVVMGVSGAGKTSVAEALAARLGWTFQEGDGLHPAANIAKMRAGVPLTDADRTPWLAAVAAWVDDCRAAARPGVITCSALKRDYRDVLIGSRPDVRLVYLRGDRGLIANRLAQRQGHFMPASLLDSQFGALEAPGPDENPLIVDIGPPPEQLVETIIREIGASAVPDIGAADRQPRD
jgi:carbohydrate kinase (thermoresistant glucokinase family)